MCLEVPVCNWIPCNGDNRCTAIVSISIFLLIELLEQVPFDMKIDLNHSPVVARCEVIRSELFKAVAWYRITPHSSQSSRVFIRSFHLVRLTCPSIVLRAVEWASRVCFLRTHSCDMRARHVSSNKNRPPTPPPPRKASRKSSDETSNMTVS